MKKILTLLIVTVLIVGLIFAVLVFGFNFRDIEHEFKYNVVENLGNDKIAEYTIEQYFEYYKTHGLKTRLSDYKIHKILLCDDVVNKEYMIGKNGFVFQVSYDVKPYFGDLFSDWYAGNGVDNGNGWCINKTSYYMISVEDKQYVLNCIGTMY